LLLVNKIHNVAMTILINEQYEIEQFIVSQQQSNIIEFFSL